MQAVTAAGGVLFRIKGEHVEVLLIRRNGHWDLPKGKLEEGESIAGCAVREVAEEVGVPPPLVAHGLDATWHSYEMGGQFYAKTTHWFLMLSSAKRFRPQHEEQIESTRWVALDKAKRQVGFDNLRIVLERAGLVFQGLGLL